MKRSIQSILVLIVILPTDGATALGEQPPAAKPSRIKVAAVQIRGYDKTDVPRPGYDPSEAMVPYIDRAGRDGAE